MNNDTYDMEWLINHLTTQNRFSCLARNYTPENAHVILMYDDGVYKVAHGDVITVFITPRLIIITAGGTYTVPSFDIISNADTEIFWQDLLQTILGKF